MADRTLKAIITGSSAGAVAAFEETALAADATAVKASASAEASTAKMGGFFSKFGALAAGVVPGADVAFGSIGSKMEETSGKASGFAGALGAIPVPIVAIGAAALGVAGIAAKLGVAFDAAVQKISANADISSAAAQKIGQAFLNTAGTTTFSGQQIAEAFAPVAAQLGQTQGKALNAAQAMTVMRSAIDLAEASGTTLGAATGDLSKIMQAFGMKTNESAEAANSMFAASRAMGTSVDTVTASLGRVRGQLGAASPSLKDMSALMIDLSQHGEANSRAMTGVANSLAGLLAPSKTVAKAQAALGLTFRDGKGNMLPFSDIIGELQPKLAGLGNAQATAMLKSVGFGNASAKLVQTIEAGPAAFEKASNAIDKNGSVADNAAKTTNTFSGAWAKVKAGVEDALTSLGTKLAPVLTTVGNKLAEVVAWISNHWPQISAVISAVFNAIKPVITGFINQAKGIITTLTGIISFISDVFHGKWGKAWDDIKKIFDGVVQFIKGSIERFTAPFKLIEPALFLVWTDIKTGVSDAWDAIVNFFTAIPGRIVGALGDVVGIIGGSFASMGTWIDTNVLQPVVGFFTGLPNRLLTALGDIVGTVFGALLQAATWVNTNVLQPVLGFFTGLPGRIVTALGDVVGTIFAALLSAGTWVFQNVMVPVVGFFIGLPGNIVTALGDIVSTIWGGLKTAAQWVYDNVIGKVVGFFKDVGNDISKALGGVEGIIEAPFKAAWAVIGPIFDTIKSAISFITGGGGVGAGLNAGPASGGAPPGHKAGGGHVRAGETNWVGEQGMELFTPDVPGTITPNNRLGQGPLGGRGSGGTYIDNRVFNLTVPALTPQQLVDALKRYQQQNGSIPVKTTG